MEKNKWKNTSEKDVGLCNWVEGRVCTEEGKDLSIVKREEKRGPWVHW